MHDLEPFYNWRNFYIASEDNRSPFHERGLQRNAFHRADLQPLYPSPMGQHGQQYTVCESPLRRLR